MSAALVLRGSALMILVLGLSACGRGMSDLETWVAEVKNRKSTQIEPVPTIKPYEAFTYEAAGRRDPFIAVEPQRMAGAGAGNGLRPDMKRDKETLEQYPLDALRMQGIIRTQKATYALVKAPDNVIHRVSIGQHMGQNYGEVKTITETEITLTELVEDGFGAYVQRPAVLSGAE